MKKLINVLLHLSTVDDKINFIKKYFGSIEFSRNHVNVVVACPICGTNKKKLSIRLDNDKTHCWICGWGSRSLGPLLYKCFGKQAVHEYNTNFSAGYYTSDEFRTSTHANDAAVYMPNHSELVYKLASNEANKAYDYIVKRKYTINDAYRYKLFVCPEHRDYVCFPSYDANGELNYYVGRYYGQQKIQNKYVNSNIKKTEIIFNELNIDWNIELILVEGPFDLMRVGSLNATCLLGSELDYTYALFCKIVENNTPVCVCLDPDAVEKSNKICAELVDYGVNVRYATLKKDPGDTERFALQAAIAKAKPYVWKSQFLNKLLK